MFKMMDYITGLSIAGAGAVAAGYTLPANLFWSISNPYLVGHNIMIKEYKQARLFAVFAAFAFAGVIVEVFTEVI